MYFKSKIIITITVCLLVSINLKARVSLCPYFHSEDINIYYYNLMMMDKCFLSSISDSLYCELMNGNKTFFVRCVGFDVDGQVCCYNIRHNHRYAFVQCDTICHNEFIRYLNTHKSIEWIAGFLINEDALKDNCKLKQLALQSFTSTSLISINYIFPRKAYVFYPSLKKYWETHVIPSKEDLISEVDSMLIEQRNELKTLLEYSIDENEIKKIIRIEQQLKKGDGTNDSFDDLILEYDGNKLVGVTDDAQADSYWGEIPQVPLYIHRR